MATPPVPIWRQRDNFSRPAHQRLVEKLNAQDRMDLTDATGRKLWRRVGYIVNEGPNEEEDFTDARYWVQLVYCEPLDEGELDQDDAIKFTPEIESEGQPHIICATNIGEMSMNEAAFVDGDGGSHVLSIGQHVMVTAIEQRQVDTTAVVFTLEAHDRTVPVVFSSTYTTGGCYNGKILGWSTGAAPGLLSAALTHPADDNAIIQVVEEDGLSGHGAQLGSYSVGVIRGYIDTDPPKAIVYVPSAKGRQDSPDVLGAAGEGAESADTSTWTRGGTPITLYLQTRTFYDHGGSKILYGYQRPVKFDAMGKLYEIGPETRYVVDDVSDCGS